MKTRLSVDLLTPGALNASERDAWRGFTAASPRHRSPFFSLDFALAADGVVPGASVAVVHRGGEIAGFLPFQKRGAAAQPLAAPLCDYHGLVAAPGAELDLAAVLRLVGVNSYRFGGLVAAAPPRGTRLAQHTAFRADLSAGLNAWLAERPQSRKFFKDKERARRAAERDLGPLQFEMEAGGPGLLSFVIAAKREQYRRTACHDIFACGWTEALLRRLWEERTAGFGGRIATLHAGGRLVAAEFGLRAGPIRHVWFPAYDSRSAHWGPGALLMVEMMKAAGADPSLSELDYGAGGSSFKRYFADPAETVYEGSLELEAWRKASARAADLTLSAAPLLRQAAQVRERVRRRFDVITACETNPAAWLGGAADAFINASRRGANVTAI